MESHYFQCNHIPVNAITFLQMRSHYCESDHIPVNTIALLSMQSHHSQCDHIIVNVMTFQLGLRGITNLELAVCLIDYILIDDM